VLLLCSIVINPELGEGYKVKSIVSPSGGGGISLNIAVNVVVSWSTFVSIIGFKVSVINEFGIQLTNKYP
jgi:hypothetical protein